MKTIALLTLFLSAAVLAQAASPPTVTVAWVAPTQNTDGTAINGALTYQLYVGASGKETSFGSPVSASPFVITPTPAPGSNVCVQVTAIANGVESARSTEACTTIPYPTPNFPAVITIVIK